MMKPNVRVRSLFVAAAAMWGCTNAVGCALNEDGIGDDPVFTETQVTLSADAEPQVYVRTIRLSEQRHLTKIQLGASTGETHVGTVKQAISASSCSGFELQFWSNQNYSGDTICFSGTGTATLANYSRGTGGGTWSTGKNSFKAGVYRGYLTRPIDCSPSTFSFAPGAELSSLSTCNQLATYLTITQVG